MRLKIGSFVLVIFSLAVVLWSNSGTESMSLEDYIILGNKMGVEGNHLEASKAFKNALLIDPYSTLAYLGLGIAYGNVGRSKEAIEVLKEGIKFNSTHNSVAQMQMGIASIAYNKMSDKTTAVKYAKRALQIYTDQGDYAGVALVGQKLKQYASKR